MNLKQTARFKLKLDWSKFRTLRFKLQKKRFKLKTVKFKLKTAWLKFFKLKRARLKHKLKTLTSGGRRVGGCGGGGWWVGGIAVTWPVGRVGGAAPKGSPLISSLLLDKRQSQVGR